MIIFLLESQFNTNPDIIIQEFSSSISCENAKKEFSNMAINTSGKVIMKCVKK